MRQVILPGRFLYLALAERDGASIATADDRLARSRGIAVLQVPHVWHYSY